MWGGSGWSPKADDFLFDLVSHDLDPTESLWADARAGVWWVGAVLVVVCMVMMVRMMSHGHSGYDRRSHDGRTGPERKLASPAERSTSTSTSGLSRCLDALRRPHTHRKASRVRSSSEVASTWPRT